MSGKSQISFLLALIVSLLGQNLYAVTKVAVGPATCQPSLVHFSTIGAAVAAVPYSSTIFVCPGTYQEQVVITQPLTIQGVTDGVGDAAIVAVPVAGLAVNGTSPYWGPVAAQVLVESVGVTISDIIVDGTGASCVSGTNAVIGITYINVGASNDATAAGKVQNSTVRNVKTGCFQGRGIQSDSSYITIANNEIHDVEDEGILTTGGTRNSILDNNLQRPGYYGIASWTYGYPASPTSGNTVFGATSAGLIIGFGYASASKNTLLNNPFVGLWIYDDFEASVSQNTVTGSQYDLEINYSCCNTVQSNVLNNSSQDGIRDENSFGSNTITKNTVNESAYGIFTDSSVGGDTLVPNSLYNVVVTVDPGTLPGPGIPPNP